MTRMYKQQERRGVSPRRPKIGGSKTGAKKDNLSKGYREHENALGGGQGFFPKVEKHV